MSTTSESYRLGRRLSATGAAEVHEAAHPRLPGRFAIKIFKSSFVEADEAPKRFRAEVEAVAAIRHPNVAQVLEVGSMPDGAPFVVMEYLEGRTLAERLAEARALSSSDVVGIVRAVAGALQAAHAHGIVHRELRADNLFLAAVCGCDRGFIKVLNFGVAQLRGASGALDGHLDVDGARTFSPEQAQGRMEEIDGRTDQFALAAIAYRMLTGVDAFRAEDPIAALYQVVHETPRPPSELARVSPEVDAVLARGLAKRREERYETVLGFARALEEAAAGLVTPAPTPLMRVGTPPFVPEVKTVPAEVVMLGRPASREILPLLPEDDDFDDSIDRIPRNRGLQALFALVLLAGAGGAAAVHADRLPIHWRESPLWHALHLPAAVDDTPAPAPQSSPPAEGVMAEGHEANGQASPPGAAFASAPESAEAPAGMLTASPQPSETPVSIAPWALPEAPASETVPSDGEAAVRPTDQAVSKAPESSPSRVSRRGRRWPRREEIPLQGMVWSERLQRLVRVGAESAPPAGRPAP